MMLYPPVAELVEKVGSRYQLVNLVARRARALSITKEGEIPSDRKPVSEAIDEVYTGRLTIKGEGREVLREGKETEAPQDEQTAQPAAAEVTESEEPSAEVSVADGQEPTEEA